MPELSRRLLDPNRESWGIFYDRVHVGGISKRDGIPQGVPEWQWSCGFHCDADGSDDHFSGIAETFDEARAGFEAAWQILLPRRSPADFRDARHREAWTAEKYARFDRGNRTPPRWPLPGFED
jgi:hypothetical protein